MTNMVEKVARALWKKERDSKAHAEPFRLSWYEDDARVAIEAMREPTDEMISKGDLEACRAASDAGSIFTAMIDAALSPPQSGDTESNPQGGEG